MKIIKLSFFLLSVLIIFFIGNSFLQEYKKYQTIKNDKITSLPINLSIGELKGVYWRIENNKDKANLGEEEYFNALSLLLSTWDIKNDNSARMNELLDNSKLIEKICFSSIYTFTKKNQSYNQKYENIFNDLNSKCENFYKVNGIENIGLTSSLWRK